MRTATAKLMILCLALSSLAAQHQGAAAAKPKTFTIHTVLRSDGMPVPGVPVYVLDAKWREGPKDDGWLRSRDYRRARLAASQFVSSDPNGVITIDVAQGKLSPHLVSVGSGFLSTGLKKVKGKWLLPVVRLEQYAVRAVDEAGQAMVRFPVAMHAGHDRLVELTDARGIAVFATTTLPAEVIAAPAGWQGPLDEFPVLNAKTPGKAVKLVVPPFGTVRLQTLREGKPAPTRVFWGLLQGSPRPRVNANGGRANCRGIEFQVVPTRGTLTARLRAWPVTEDIDIVGPRPAGQILVVDVETDPVRPKLTFQVSAEGFDPKQVLTASVRVRAQTDVGWFEEGRQLGANRQALLTFGSKPLQGDRLLRVEVELTAFGSRRKWKTTVDVDKPLTMTVMDLGEIELPEQMPALRGRVVDWRGKPVANASVGIQPEPDVVSTKTYRASTDKNGNFFFRGEPFRKSNGELARFVAVPSKGYGQHAQHGAASKPVAVGSEVVLTLNRPTTGYVEVHLPKRSTVPRHLLQFVYVPDKGKRLHRNHIDCIQPGNGFQTYHVGPLPPGRGTLLVCLRPGCELVRAEDIEVAAGEVSHDERLRDLDLSGLVTTVTVRVVDEHGKGLPKAQVEYGKHPDRITSASHQTDTLQITVAKQEPRQIMITAEGKEPVLLTDVKDGAVIRMGPRKRVRVSVRGLPKDLPRARLALMFRSLDRTNLLPWHVELLEAGDFAMVPVPPAGAYYLRLCVVKNANDPSSGWTSIGQSPTPAKIGDGDLKPLQYQPSDADLTRIRKMLR